MDENTNLDWKDGHPGTLHIRSLSATLICFLFFLTGLVDFDTNARLSEPSEGGLVHFEVDTVLSTLVRFLFFLTGLVDFETNARLSEPTEGGLVHFEVDPVSSGNG